MDDNIINLLRTRGAHMRDAPDGPIAEHFGNKVEEYAAVANEWGLYPHLRRGLIQVRGKDRAAWLHNLCTQNIKVMPAGDGTYAFAVNVKGRILFDMNVWVDPDELWLDIDRRWLALAMKHLTKYTVVEDVVLTDRSADFFRWVVLGPAAPKWLAAVGPSNVSAMAHGQHITVPFAQAGIRFIRTDGYGPFAVELNVDREHAVDAVDQLIALGKPLTLRWCGLEAVDSLRIEQGIPWSVSDLYDDILPAETRQLERAVNFQKGCYLGQEIVERMRSRGGLARQLVGLTLDAEPPLPSPDHRPLLNRGDSASGVLTSAVHSIGLNQWVGLGYVRLPDAKPGTELHISDPAGAIKAVVSPLPFSSQSLS